MVRAVAALSLVYDAVAGSTLLVAPAASESLFGLAPADPPIYGQLNGIFLLAVGLGYILPYRDPVRYRAYLWIFGVLLKSAGAVVFIADYAWRAGPSAMLLFALCDAAVAALTWWALLKSRGPAGT